MQRFWRLVAGSLLTFVIAMGGVLAYTRSKGPLSPYMSLFRKPDGSACAHPCIFGIRTNETSWEEALTLLRAHPLTRDLVQTELTTRLGALFEGKHIVVRIQRDPTGRHILEIRVQLNPTFLERQRNEFEPMPELPESPLRDGVLGDVVAALGPPDYLQMYNTGTGPGRLLRLFYQSSYLTLYHARHNPERVTVRDEFDSVVMAIRPTEVNPSLFRWSGFTTFNRYNEQFGRRP